MADKQKEGTSKKRSSKSKKGKGSDNPSTACELEPPSLSPPKLDFQIRPIDLQDDPPVLTTVLSDLQSDPHCVGPFQGQDGSPEPITQTGISRQSTVDRVSDSQADSTGALPRASTVDLAVRTPVSRRRSETDMEALTRQMSDEKAFREERSKGAPRVVFVAWGISPPLEEPIPPAQSVNVRPEQPSSVSETRGPTGRSPGNRDETLMGSKGTDSRGSCHSRTPQSDAHGSAGAHKQPARGRSRDPTPARRGQTERSRSSSACRASPR